MGFTATLLEQAQHFGHLEALLHQRYPQHELVVRNLAWSADTPELQPRPDNFADTDQHLFHERADLILVAFGFNESFRGREGVSDFTESFNRIPAGEMNDSRYSAWVMAGLRRETTS